MLDVAGPLLGLARPPGIRLTQGGKRWCAGTRPAAAQELTPGSSTRAKATLVLRVGKRPAVVYWTSVDCWCTGVVMMSEGGRIWAIPGCPNHGIFLPGGLPGNRKQEGSAGTQLAPLLRMNITPRLRPGLSPGVPPPGAEGLVLYRCHPRAPRGMGIQKRSKVQ